MLADLCLLVLPPDSHGQMFIQCAYDLIRESYLPNRYIDSEKVPTLVAAMKRGRPLRLPASSTSYDTINLTQALELGHSGHLLAAFVPSVEDEFPQMGILLVSPYANHRWSRDDQAFLNIIAATMAPILQQTHYVESIQNELQMAKHNLQSFQNLLKETQNENSGLQAEIKEISRQAIQHQEEKQDELLENLRESQELIEHLRSENLRLQKGIESLSVTLEQRAAEPEQLKEELKLALTEIAQLKNQLLEAETLAEARTAAIIDKDIFPVKQDLPTTDHFEKFTADLSDEQIGIFTSVAQELRQPMSSIVGYTDILLSESSGILGAAQRKFLERIKASIQRMEITLDDLVEIISMDTKSLTLHPEEVDLEDVIDTAIAETQGQFQERGIVLRLDLPAKMPRLLADQDALQQILIHLLKNAGTASPINGEIFLRTSIYQADDNEDFVLMQVADQGGGIPSDDLPRVFSRLYRTDNPLIPGIGETGVGLSIVKALVEAHNGRIWVDTEIGKGSTFSLLIPLANGKNGPNPAVQEEINHEGES
jgi:signal transduction histidine kinase